MIDGLTIQRTNSQNGIARVSVNYDDYFDRNTGEKDSFSAEFEMREYLQGMQELKQKGKCSINGKYGSLLIEGKRFLHMTMTSNREQISIPITLEDLALNSIKLNIRREK